MDLKQLQKSGGFVSADLVKRKCVWAHKDEAGEEHKEVFDVFIKRAPFGAIERALLDETLSRSSAIISACIRLGDKGQQELSYDQAYQLQPSLARIFMEAIATVNDVGDASGEA